MAATETTSGEWSSCKIRRHCTSLNLSWVSNSTKAFTGVISHDVESLLVPFLIEAEGQLSEDLALLVDLQLELK